MSDQEAWIVPQAPNLCKREIFNEDKRKETWTNIMMDLIATMWLVCIETKIKNKGSLRYFDNKTTLYMGYTLRTCSETTPYENLPVGRRNCNTDALDCQIVLTAIRKQLVPYPLLTSWHNTYDKKFRPQYHDDGELISSTLYYIFRHFSASKVGKSFSLWDKYFLGHDSERSLQSTYHVSSWHVLIPMACSR